MKSLVLAEKPSVAREIARVLKCHNKQKGYMEGSQHVVTWALGHLVTLAEPDDYDAKYKQWRMEDLPMLPEKMKLKVIKQTAHQYQVVKNLMNRADISDLVIATDAGREGELVARWIMEQARWKKPFKRLWISSQTDDAIQQGFRQLKPGREYDNLYAAAVCRAEADWLIGLNVTRALTCKYNAQLSAGRVQTPTLAMIVQREHEINHFKPVDYWTIRADFGDYYGDWRDSKNQGRIFDGSRAASIAAKIKGKIGVIKEIKKETKSEAPPLAYDLTELQRDGNRRFGWSAQKTLSVLQSLYEVHKVVTYPRTDSRYITRDIVPTLPARLQAMQTGPYTDFIRPLLSQKIQPGKRFVDDSKVTDHHAIIPTEQKLNLNAFSVDEKKLYDLIARRFLAVLYPPYKYEQTTITTVVEEEIFLSRGKVVREIGWRGLHSQIPEKEDKKEESLPEQLLQEKRQGESRKVENCRLNKAKTKPPARYTEATLLTAMESPGKYIDDEELREAMKGSGLGTPATRAEIIEKLFNTFYIERQGKEIVPTAKGIQLIELAPPSLRSPELTAQWEQQLTDIARGKSSKGKMITSIRDDASNMVRAVAQSSHEYKPENVSKSKCPLCGQNMLLVNTRQGKMLICPDRSCGHRQPEKQADTDVFSKNKHGERVNPKLMARYSDKKDLGQSLGDKLKEALQNKEKNQ